MDVIGPVRHEIVVHGHRRVFVEHGPPPGSRPEPVDTVLLIHGIGDSGETWSDVVPALARTHRVIAPDLLGHGGSDKPRADYSVGGYANGMRDLLSLLDIDAVTVVGHSLGGGVAMQFAYQYPERCRGIVLVSTGGVGREVHPMLRLMSLTRTDAALRLLRLPGSRLVGQAWATAARLTGSRIGTDAADFLRIFESMPDGASREAVLRTLRATVDHRGQLFSMLDRCYLARGLPTMIVWGARDPIVPVRHAHVAHDALPGSRLEVFEASGHFPHHTESERFVSVLEDFLTVAARAATTVTAAAAPGEWRELLGAGG